MEAAKAKACDPSHRGKLGLFAPSMGLPLCAARSALRGQRCALSKFATGKFVTAKAWMPKRTSAQPMAQRTRHGTCRVNVRFDSGKSPSHTQKARLAGGLGLTQVGRIVRPIHGAHPSALRAPGPALRAVQICSRQICRTGFASLTLPAKYKGPPFGRAFVFGWETRIRT